jgi:cobalt-zinc-cadmium efflux system membrane fusion protein
MTPSKVNPFLGRARSRIQRLSRNQILLIALAIGTVIALYFVMRGSTAPTKEAIEAATIGKASDSVVTLDSVAERLAGIERWTVSSATTSTLVANGTITYDANRVSVASSRVDGHIVGVRADLGQQVPAGGLLAILESQEVGQLRGELERARSSVDIARRNYEREDRLYREQISPQKELLEAENAYRSAQADYQSAAARLTAIGATGGRGGVFDLRSAISGTVVERNASPGATVGPSNNLFTVADLRNVWITVDVYEGDLSRVRQGAVATVVPTALGGESFLGRVTYAGGIVDTSSRTFKVRVEVANPNFRLRPGMFAQVRVETVPDGSAGAITVPDAAVQEIDGRQVVFIAGNQRGRYVARTVTLGPRTGDGRLALKGGVMAGEQIVVKGAFQLKAELTKASSGEPE